MIANTLKAWASRFVVMLPVILGAVLIVQAISFKPAPPLAEAQERRIPVSYIVATPRSFTPRISGYGTVSPSRVWTAVVQVPGTIAYINPAFIRGGSVTKGEVLLRIADQDARIALSSAEADLESAKARLDEMRLSETTTTNSLEIERKSLVLAQADLARTQQLVKKGVVSQAVVQADQREVLAQRSNVLSLENSLALLPAQIRAQEQAVAKAVLTKQSAVLDVQRTVIVAPFDARVARVDVAISQYVAAGTVLGVLDGSANPEIEVQISQRRLIALAQLEAVLGRDPQGTVPVQAASLTQQMPRKVGFVPGDPRRLSARVSLSSDLGAFQWDAEVNRTGEAVSAETRSMEVIVRVPETQSADGMQSPLLKGAFVKVDLTAPPVEGGILVPQSALRNGKVMIAGPDDRLGFVKTVPIFTFDNIAVLAPNTLPGNARIITSQPSPAIEGVLLSPQRDTVTEARLVAAAEGGAS